MRETKSVEGAEMVADFCRKKGDIRLAIEFLLLAKKKEDAFLLAKEFEKMDAYAASLGDAGTMEDFVAIAQFFEQAMILAKRVCTMPRRDNIRADWSSSCVAGRISFRKRSNSRHALATST
eukprot:EC685160.1.p2 GENE.EC685160.1~~EC685160.1.p2  ORF type:complete len:121 (+),score=37.65 EC685160.1:1-363(+)